MKNEYSNELKILLIEMTMELLDLSKTIAFEKYDSKTTNQRRMEIIDRYGIKITALEYEYGAITDARTDTI